MSLTSYQTAPPRDQRGTLIDSWRGTTKIFNYFMEWRFSDFVNAFKQNPRGAGGRGVEMNFEVCSF